MKGQIINLAMINVTAKVALITKSIPVPSIVNPDKKQFRNGAESSAKKRNHDSAYPHVPVNIAAIWPTTIDTW